MSLRVIDKGWLGSVWRFQPYLVVIEGGTLVHESEGYDLLPIVKERSEASKWKSAKPVFSEVVHCGDGDGHVNKADMFSNICSSNRTIPGFISKRMVLCYDKVFRHRTIDSRFIAAKTLRKHGESENAGGIGRLHTIGQISARESQDLGPQESAYTGR